MAKKVATKTVVAEAIEPVVAPELVVESTDWTKVFQYDENEVTIEGRLGKDPVEGKTANGVKVAKFSICNHQDRRNPDGSIFKKESWFIIRAYGKTADIAMTYLRKGRRVRIKGAIDSFQVTDRGEPRTVTVINAFRIQFLDSNKPASQGQVQTDVESEDLNAFPF